MAINNDTELLKLVRANEVTCFVLESFEDSIEIPKELSAKPGTRIWCSYPDNTTVISLYTRLKKFKSISVDYVKQDDTYNDSSIVLSTTHYLKKKLMSYFFNGSFQKSKIDFCDIIYLGGVSLWTMDNTIVMNLWKSILETKNDIEIPRLVLSMFNMEMDTNIIPFDISQSYFYIESQRKPEIQYHDSDWRPGDRGMLDSMLDVVKRKHNEDSYELKYLIYCPSFNDVVILSAKLKELQNVHMIFLTKDLDEKGATALNTRKKKDKRIIIISSNSLIPMQDVGVVFDCMTEKLEYKTANDSIKMKNVYVSKSIADQRKNIASNYCYRMCTQEKYGNLKSQHLAESKRLPLTRIFLGIVEKGFNPSKFFGDSITYNIVREEMELLKETKMVEEKMGKFKITKLGEFNMNTKLSRYNSMLLERWVKTQQSWFPGIVISCLIEKADSMYFFLPIKQKEQTIEEHDMNVKQHFEKYFKKWSSESILECYLNMWNAYADDIGTLKPSIESLKVWCREHSINFKSIYELLELIVDTFDKLEYMNRVQITIGKFSPKKLLALVNPLLIKVYAKNMCQLVDVDKYKYIDEKHENFFLDVRRHYNPYVRVPYKLFAFSKVSIKRNRKEVRKIIFFHPVENKFLKDKRIEAPIRKEIKPASEYLRNLFPVSTGYQSPVYKPESPSGYNIDEPGGEDFTYQPESPDYRPTSPSYMPESPGYTVTEPSFVPVSPVYNAESPGYTVTEPSFVPVSPVYNAESPSYTVTEPSFVPVSPSYIPDGSPEYFAPGTPDISPEGEEESIPEPNEDEMKQEPINEDTFDFEKAFAELEV